MTEAQKAFEAFAPKLGITYLAKSDSHNEVGRTYWDGAAEIAWLAWQESARQCREQFAAWIEVQRNDIPATGKEFAAAIRAMETDA